MAHIIMADDGIEFDGRSLEQGPLGGAETSFIEMANALAARGHRVQVYNRCVQPVVHKGVEWFPLDGQMPDHADLYIANRSHKLIRHVPHAKSRIFWIHNPAGYLLKLRYQWKLALSRPIIVFSGVSHAGTYPKWAFSGGRKIVPYGLTELFRYAEMRQPSAPRAVFTSNPLRSLDWVLDAWEHSIRPAVPNAELHIFAGSATYGAVGQSKADKMGPILDRAASLEKAGVILRGPVPKAQLVDELAHARVLLYRGDIGETFCSAVAEAQAMGVPTIVQDIACMSERVRHRETGFVVQSQEEFSKDAIRLLTDDALWFEQHNACLTHQRTWTWDMAAQEFERMAGL
jgi:glycosyltransferase involved in cell wall biosynthesis